MDTWRIETALIKSRRCIRAIERGEYTEALALSSGVRSALRCVEDESRRSEGGSPVCLQGPEPAGSESGNLASQSGKRKTCGLCCTNENRGVN